MLTAEEKKFIEYWQTNRLKDKNILRQLRYGLPVGLLLAIVILLNFTSGWYERANMVAFSQSTPIVLMVALLAIIIFWSIFSKRHKWEMNEQRFKELLHKEQQNSNENSHTTTN